MEFDELFLRLMIAHHEGALDMVKELKRQPGSAYDPLMFEFVSDLSNALDKSETNSNIKGS